MSSRASLCYRRIILPQESKTYWLVSLGLWKLKFGSFKRFPQKVPFPKLRKWRVLHALRCLLLSERSLSGLRIRSGFRRQLGHPLQQEFRQHRTQIAMDGPRYALAGDMTGQRALGREFYTLLDGPRGPGEGPLGREPDLFAGIG